MQLLFDLWMGREEVPGPGQGVRRGLMTGDEQCDELVAQLPTLLIALAVVCARGRRQRAEHVASPARVSIEIASKKFETPVRYTLSYAK
ncbi:MAG: hypothetical protein RLZZ450_2580 [Pseudomonadota bacterium]